MNEVISVSEFNDLLNQTLLFAYPEVLIEGEVSSFKVNQGKWVFFDLKDESSTVGCFMMIFQLKQPLEDGMLIRVKATPQLTKWGKFSLTIKEIELAGEGSAKKAYEMLKNKFEKEGLFEQDRKRVLPEYPSSILLITSKQAAAYNDFVTILNDRFKGLLIEHIQVQVQGTGAIEQIVKALEYSNQNFDKYDVVVIIRGGGSFEDLQAFNSEEIVRAIYASKIPTLVGIGHEDDISLAELVADLRASTPTDAARRLVPEAQEIIRGVESSLKNMASLVRSTVETDNAKISNFHHAMELRSSAMRQEMAIVIDRLSDQIDNIVETNNNKLQNLIRLLAGLNPESVLSRGYSIARYEGKILKSSNEYDNDKDIVLQLHKGKLLLKGKKL